MTSFTEISSAAKLTIAMIIFFPSQSNICNYNRHYAEHSGYYEGKPKFLKEAKTSSKIEFFDSNTGKQLFTAPIGRSMDDFLIESKAHGWPSFRDAEVNWDYVRILPGGEAVSVDGTHLGHNLPDRHGNRYCISKFLSLIFLLNTSRHQYHIILTHSKFSF